MSVAEDIEEDTLKPTKYPKLRVLTGGKGPPEPPKTGHNWLSTLEKGTIFICRANDKQVDFELYLLLYKSDTFALIQWQMPDGKVYDRRVDPVLFCNNHRDYEVLQVYKINEEKEEPQGSDGETDGHDERHRTD
jgi:hypothetical protein